MEHLSNNSWSVNSIRYFLLNIAQPSPFPGMDENSRHMNYLQQKDQAEQCRKKWLLCFRAMQALEWFALWRKEMRGRAQLGSRKSNECQISECLRYHPPKESRSGIVLVDNRFPFVYPGSSFHWVDFVTKRTIMSCLEICCAPLPAEIHEWPMQTEALQNKVFLRGKHMDKTQVWYQRAVWGCWDFTLFISQCLELPDSRAASSSSGLLHQLLCQKTPWPQYLW